jgi:O-antigen ligase
MHLILFLIGLVILLVTTIRKPLIGVLAMTAALQVEMFFLGYLPAGLTLGRAVGFFAMLGWLVNHRGFRTSRLLLAKDIAVPALLFVVVTVVSAMFARNAAWAMSQAIRVAMLLVLGIMVGDTIQSRRDLLAFCWVIVLSAALGAGAALMQYGAYQQGGEIVGSIYETRQGVRFEGLTASANTLGIHLLTAIPFLFCIFFSTASLKARVVCMGLLGLTAFVLVLTVSRSNIYPLLVYMAVTYVLHRRMGKPSTMEVVMISVAVLMLGYAVVKSSDYVWERISRPVVAMEEETSGEARLEILLQAPAMMSISPILGVGLSNSRLYLMRRDAHDTISAVVGETGLIGTVLFAALCIAVLRRQVGLMRRARLTGDPLLQELAIALAGMLCVLLVWMPVKVLLYQRLFWLWVGLVVWMDTRLPPVSSGGRRLVVHPAMTCRPAGFPPAAGGFGQSMANRLEGKGI